MLKCLVQINCYRGWLHGTVGFCARILKPQCQKLERYSSTLIWAKQFSFSAAAVIAGLGFAGAHSRARDGHVLPSSEYIVPGRYIVSGLFMKKKLPFGGKV